MDLSIAVNSWRIKMRKILKKDLLIYLFTLSYILLIFAFPQIILSNLIYSICFVIIFLVSGYSGFKLFYPDENINSLKKVILLLEFSILLTIFISLILKYSQELNLKTLMAILSILTLVFLSFTYIRKVIFLRSTKSENEIFISEKNPEQVSGRHWNFINKDLLMISIFVFLIIINLVLPIGTLIWKIIFWILSGLIMMFIPGYLLIAIIFPNKGDIEEIERFGISWGLSLVITSLIGLPLYYLTHGLFINTLIIFLAIFSIILCVITLLKRKKIELKNMFLAPKTEKVFSILIIITIILACAAAIQLNFSPKESPDVKTEPKFTQLNILDSNNHTVPNPILWVSGERNYLNIKVVNHEQTGASYQLFVKVNNKILKRENFTLKNNEEKVLNMRFTAGLIGQKDMAFLLYKLPDLKKVYIYKYLVLNIKSNQSIGNNSNIN